MSPKSSLPKGYNDQKSLIINLYPTFLGKTKDDIWTKVDVRQCRPDEPMSFTVQSKPAGETTTKWKTASKVVVITPTNWGRIDTEDKKNFLMTSFKNF